MKNKEEKLKNLENEDFYLLMLDGTFMPNNEKYTKLTMFNDVFYIENENDEKEYVDIYFILKVKQMINDNIDLLEKLSLSKASPIRTSHKNEFTLKINDKIYKINKYLCNEDGMELFNKFQSNLYEILDIKH